MNKSVLILQMMKEIMYEFLNFFNFALADY